MIKEGNAYADDTDQETVCSILSPLPSPPGSISSLRPSLAPRTS